MYAGAGYDFLFRADHWVCSDVTKDADDFSLLWLDGVELDGRDDGGVYWNAMMTHGVGTVHGRTLCAFPNI